MAGVASESTSRGALAPPSGRSIPSVPWPKPRGFTWSDAGQNRWRAGAIREPATRRCQVVSQAAQNRRGERAPGFGSSLRFRARARQEIMVMSPVSGLDDAFACVLLWRSSWSFLAVWVTRRLWVWHVFQTRDLASWDSQKAGQSRLLPASWYFEIRLALQRWKPPESHSTFPWNQFHGFLESDSAWGWSWTRGLHGIGSGSQGEPDSARACDLTHTRQEPEAGGGAWTRKGRAPESETGELGNGLGRGLEPDSGRVGKWARGGGGWKGQ